MRLSRTTSTLVLAALIVLIAGCRGGGKTNAPGGGGSATQIPSATPYPVVPTPIIVSGGGVRGGGETTYMVEPGDTLLTIAARFGTTVEAIQQRNKITGAEITAGLPLLIPAGSAASTASVTPTPQPGGTAPRATSTAASNPGSGGTQSYVVQPGDSALAIAFKFDVTLEALAAANGMTTDDVSRLQAGQTLQIPRPR